jgi:hypothetical protein
MAAGLGDVRMCAPDPFTLYEGPEGFHYLRCELVHFLNLSQIFFAIHIRIQFWFCGLGSRAPVLMRSVRFHRREHHKFDGIVQRELGRCEGGARVTPAVAENSRE